MNSKEQYGRYIVRLLGGFLFLAGISLTDAASPSHIAGLQLSFGSIIFMVIGLVLMGISFIDE